MQQLTSKINALVDKIISLQHHTQRDGLTEELITNIDKMVDIELERLNNKVFDSSNHSKITIYDIDDLSVRTLNILCNAKISNLFQLTQYSRKQIKALRGCGEKSLTEIDLVLKKYKISLND